MLKLLLDLFSRRATGEVFFFTNDLKVLVEVLVRELGDREHGDPLRVDYLNVLGGMLASSAYLESGHRRADVVACLHALRDEENYDHDSSTADLQRIATALLVQYFSAQPY